MVITAEQPRTASRVGRAAARVALTSIALASLAGLVLTVWVLQRTVVRPVERLGQEARRVAGAEGLTGRVTEQGSAELAHLAGAINAMLSDLERADRALRESEARMRSAFHNAAVGFALAWPNGTVSQANQRWAEMLGTTAEELARRPFSEIIHPEDAAGFHEQLQDALTRRLDGFRAEVRCLRADGESVWTDLAVGLVHSGSGDLENVVLVIADISDRKRAEDELRSMSHRDGLTGLANRRAFEERLEREWRAATRDGGSLALLLLDVDHFKTYNDAYGHLAGDECLVQVAGALREGCRRTIDLPCRWGGEEFAVILADTGLDQALACAERIRALVEAAALPRPGQMPDHVTVSVGVAIAQPMPSAGAGGLLEAADRAMYAAKHGGRNRVAHATAEAETAEPS